MKFNIIKRQITPGLACITVHLGNNNYSFELWKVHEISGLPIEKIVEGKTLGLTWTFRGSARRMGNTIIRQAME